MSSVHFTDTAFPTTIPSQLALLQIIEQDNKQAAREASEAIHIRINIPALSYNTGTMYIFNHLLGAIRSYKKSDQMVD